MAKLTSLPELIRIVRKSGLFEVARLEEYLQAHPEVGADPQKIIDGLVQEGILTCFQAKHLSQGRYKGLFLEKYKLLHLLGKGANSLVFLAEHSILRRQVAIKVLPMHMAAHPEMLERFYREARAAASLDHPNLVRAHDVSHWRQTHFIVMEYVEGPNLEEYVQQHGPVPYRLAAGFVCQVVEGLQHAHERGVVHRDIKPANLLLTKNGLIKILDMGLARFFHDDHDQLTSLYSKEAVLGTVDYIAPEQALDGHDADIRSDLYSLGATFYRLVTGRTPFGGSYARQKLMAHQLWNPDPLHQVQPEVPEALSAIVAKMMAKKPSDRYQTPAEVLQALQFWIGPGPAPGKIRRLTSPPSATNRWTPRAWAASILGIK